MPHIEMLDTTVLFYEGGHVVEEILLTDIYKQGFTFEEYCEAQAIQGREAFRIKEESDGRLEIQ